ncbi:hypothetical protein TcYC6_0000430 [Trypanosoma cruzi]|uniref:Uncharacterized protein n=2 Tax=Trypanosoma cruzi TaxID=5693 RepID=Q4D2Q8_TRYCC|nr:hypothetical protein, conserved [Trypanosoma cruzi]EAN86808.1 hypothetical protein, conserved [Trypanosoma cruzi]KAF5217588.1 hypothetical protein ECC02_009512 [Trypanosoma cruzi]KAF8280087.1 hypothetical protein TcYC6_0000430 [Trypanosoma cruzi]RNC50647.1 hypothetical protein TcCL_ESM12299 [Trypanosoma cruzi]|eukprot:XP_808659.1 hypothetical protein [Trypanosoma cruzi strain CL Brener]
MSSVKALNPSLQARRDPYYKRNHMGRVTCTLCDVCCTDDNNFLKHIAGKTHCTQLERRERYARREERLAVEEELNREACRRAAQEKATRELLLQQQDQQAGSRGGATGTAIASFAPFGRPQFNYCTENDPELFQTKVWMEFFFPQAAAGVRPLHRWRSAREQDMERPPDDSVVYLLLACEGYVTIAVKFPSKLPRTSASSSVGMTAKTMAPYGSDVAVTASDEEEGRYHCSWDPLKKVYSLFFILG